MRRNWPVTAWTLLHSPLAMYVGRAMTAPREIATGVWVIKPRGANVYFVSSEKGWVLIDAGWPGAARTISAAAARLFGPATQPAAILLTHAQPDHLGSLVELAHSWQSPVYAPAADLPLLAEDIYDHPEMLEPVGRLIAAAVRRLPDQVAARLSNAALRELVSPLQASDAVPGLPDWRMVLAAGHSPGHVVYFRSQDRVAICGDVVLTGPLWGLSARQRITLPPWIASSDWDQTKQAVATLAGLEPLVLASGHGTPLSGPFVASELHAFARRVAPR